MRIIIVSQHFWPETMPINAVATAFVRLGAEVRVLTGKPNYPDGPVFPGYRAWGVSAECWQGVAVHRVPLVPRGRGGAVRLAINYASFIASAALFGPAAVPWARADVVLVFGTSPFLQALAGWTIARAKRARLVAWVQDLWPEGLAETGFVRSPVLLDTVGRAVAWIYRRSDLVLVQSPAMLAVVRARAGSTPVEVALTPGPVASGGDRSARLPIELAPGFNIVFAGNLGQVQALPTVLDAAERLGDLPGVRFVLVGSGRMQAELRRTIARRGLRNVDFVGRFPAEDVAAILSQAEALLLTLARGTALAMTIPSKLAEYLAAGRPIVAAVDGEAAHIVRESGAGEPVAAEDAAGLAAAVRSLHAATSASRAARGTAARRYYEQHFDPERLLPALLARLQALEPVRA